MREMGAENDSDDIKRNKKYTGNHPVLMPASFDRCQFHG